MFGQLSAWLMAACMGWGAPYHIMTNDPVLFTVNGKEVTVSEFKYIYNKTNGDKATYDEKSLREYMQLYIDFKLQVAKGVELGIDKNPNVQTEQLQYKRQLASSYLIDREITEKLVREAYEWSKEDRSISHIMITVRESASEQEKRDAFERAKKVKSEVTAANFAQLAAQYSDDGNSKGKGGSLGFYNVMQLPYEMEKAMYGTAKGSISDIVRTKYGYHIIKVDETRPAYGQIQAAHIIIRTKGDDAAKNARAKTVADSLYNVLKGGASFEEVAARYSEDNETKNKGGILGWITINKHAKAFEDAVFSLKKDGDICAPVQTTSGWHIIKRLKGIQQQTYQEAKSELINKIKKNERFELVQASLVERIKKESDYKVNEANRKLLLDSLNNSKTFLSYNWQPSQALRAEQRELFTIGNFKGTIADFILEATRNPADRVNLEPRTMEAALERIMNRVATQKCLAYEETQLEVKYPEFKALVREYEEGILLFEVKKQLVWDKAAGDKEGLEKYYNDNKNKYKWNERATVTLYNIRSQDEKLIKKIKALAKKKDAETVKNTFNGDSPIVQTTSNTYEKGKNPEVDAMQWKKGSMTENTSKDGMTSFIKMETIIASTNKTLDEARGYVVADYQDFLEKQLIEELRKTYKVEIKEDALKALIKK